MKVVIAGAGIAGLSVARALVARGIRPTVVALDHGATAAGAGIVSAQFWDPELRAWARRSQRIIRSLIPVHVCGMAQVALSAETARQVERLGGRPLPEGWFPMLRIEAASYSPEEFWVDNRSLLRAFGRGVRLVRARIRRVQPTCVLTDRGLIEADRVVVAMGAATPGVRVKRQRTRLVRVRAQIPTMLHVLDTGLYLRPEGRTVLAGDGDPRQAIEVRGRARLVSEGVVAMSRRPIVRFRNGMWWMTGFGGDGLALAPALGEEIADQIVRRG